MIQRVAKTKTNILIMGESGTGKELIARMIHYQGVLKGTPLVPVNCGAIPENLIESEMFGHKRGSFTGAIADKKGLFESANGGTLFLDEVGELPLGMQVKMLRAIQERCFRKVGGTEDIRVDVRIIAATNRDLEQEVQKGRFREDLFYRLNVISIHAPPLRERDGDVKMLADFFLKRFAKSQNKNLKGIHPDALEALVAYHWPGNIRELENVIERSVALETGKVISLGSLPPGLAGGNNELGVNSAGSKSSSSARTRDLVIDGNDIRVPVPDFSQGPVDLDEVLSKVEKAFLVSALKYAGGIKKKAAKLLGITFRSIRYRLKKIGVDRSDLK